MMRKFQFWLGLCSKPCWRNIECSPDRLAKLFGKEKGRGTGMGRKKKNRGRQNGRRKKVREEKKDRKRKVKGERMGRGGQGGREVDFTEACRGPHVS